MVVNDSHNVISGLVDAAVNRPFRVHVPALLVNRISFQGVFHQVRDIYQGVDERNIDRVVLDVPEPWQAVPSIGDALVMGGVLRAFVPTIIQVQRFVLALENDGRFQMIEPLETMLRTWHVTERSVRPDHRMIAHSGFLTTAVRCAPRPTSDRLKKEVEPLEENSSDLA